MNKYCIVLYYICFQETIISEHESEKGVFLAGPEWKVLSVCQYVSMSVRQSFDLLLWDF